MDALRSFIFLVDNIPQWLVSLDELQQRCQSQHQRFSRLSTDAVVPVPRKRKQASVESLKPQGEEGVNNPLTPRRDASQASNGSEPYVLPSELARRPLHDAAKIVSTPRKRRAGSELSFDASHPNRYRIKHMAVVYYDSDIQDAFEAMVKNIAAARNNLRKGRNATTVQTRMAGLIAQASSLNRSSDKMEDLVQHSKSITSLTNSTFNNQKQASTDRFRSFEDADKHLEYAQSLCEKGAHQFLRDADCIAEIRNTRQRVSSCVQIARAEVERLKSEAPPMVSQEVNEAEEKTLVGDATPPSDNGGLKSEDPPSFEHTCSPEAKELTLSGTAAIEVDDGSDAESVIDMAAIRRTVRSTRM